MSRAKLTSRIERMEKTRRESMKTVNVPPGCNCHPAFVHSLEQLLAMVVKACPVHGVRDLTPFFNVSPRELVSPEIRGMDEGALSEQSHAEAIGLTPAELNRQSQARQENIAGQLIEYVKRLAEERAKGRRLGVDRIADYEKYITQPTQRRRR